jgi:hypothetical protein
MPTFRSRRLLVLCGLVVSSTTLPAQAGRARPGRPGVSVPQAATLVLGRPTDRSIVASVLSPRDAAVVIEVGPTPTTMTPAVRATLKANVPAELLLERLSPNARYHYRATLDGVPITAPTASFVTQRAAGSTFSFGVQGDSHPERAGRMFDDVLYLRTMARVASEQPDFYITLGDDFSIEGLISQQRLTQDNVNAVYANQRRYLGVVGQSSPLFLVNGNHEEAARFLLDGTPTSAPVLAGRARTMFFALPSPDAFYTGNSEPVEHVGLPRDYYAWTWGDALFVTIDPYWHSAAQVDAAPGGGGGGGGAQRAGGANTARRGGAANGAGNGGGGGNAMQASGVARDLWNITLGDAQYAWLKQTLEQSTAKYKFVFAHHVMGTGRGAIEMADLYEWGGKDRRGVDVFRQKRPTWAMPIHQLFVNTGVTIFFQGHDHLFARQEKDGVIYQETPNPADPTYQAFNRDAYRSGDILPNAGHLRVTVSPREARVEYVRSFLAKDETDTQKDGAIAFSYTVKPRGGS